MKFFKALKEAFIETWEEEKAANAISVPTATTQNSNIYNDDMPEAMDTMDATYRLYYPDHTMYDD